MSDKDLLYTISKGVATITLNRPERMNALTLDLEERLHVLLDKADADKKVKVVILTGSGSAFCAGYDMAPEANEKKKTIPAGQSTADLIEFWHRIDGAHSLNLLRQFGHRALCAIVIATNQHIAIDAFLRPRQCVSTQRMERRDHVYSFRHQPRALLRSRSIPQTQHTRHSSADGNLQWNRCVNHNRARFQARI